MAWLLERLPQKVSNNKESSKVSVQEAVEYVDFIRKQTRKTGWLGMQSVVFGILPILFVSLMKDRLPAFSTILILAYLGMTMLVTLPLLNKILSNFWYQRFRLKTIIMEDGLVTKEEKKKRRSMRGKFIGYLIITIPTIALSTWAIIRYLIIKVPYGSLSLCLYELYFVLVLSAVSLIFTYPRSKSYDELVSGNGKVQYNRVDPKRKILEPKSLTKRGKNQKSKRK